MTIKRCLLLPLLCFVTMMAAAQAIQVSNDITAKKAVFGNDKISITLNYNNTASIESIVINGQEVISENDGVYASIRTAKAAYATLHLLSGPVLQVTKNKLTLLGIVYGDKEIAIHETWTFSISADNIKFDIERSLPKAITAEQVAMPVFMFKNMDVWQGAYQDYGGLAWFYLFNNKLDTYGVHSHSSRFWNMKTGNGLLLDVRTHGQEVAMDYSRTKDNQLACTIAIAQKEMVPRLDSGTQRRRYIRNRNDVWAAVNLPAGKTTESIILSYFDCTKTFDRGTLNGINGAAASAVLNTIARIGVIDKQHFGGNSWHTPYGPICLHEQYIAQMGLAINDSNYLKGYSQCLDFYRDNAIKPDGRVWARWAYSNEDMMPGQVTDKGFYEAQWGFLLDANPDYVTNVAELYDQTGDLSWVKQHQLSCEKALDWILKRDSNNNGLAEMMTDNHKQRRGSDWIDIIWASYENAFVNAKLYHALVLWAAIEKQFGNKSKEKYYSRFAKKLKDTFNKPVTEGGLWDDDKKCYVHWREKDNSVHGNNMVTPVNFMAIAYGICDDAARKKAILDGIEAQMQKENLFFWPLCMYSYAPGEGNDWQFPFPNYENGDLFLSWGAQAVNAYAGYKPELAVKYVKNVLAQYSKDGLAFQRYGRARQDGLGDDILSGNSLAVVGLYQAVYGINPLYNRFYLNPHITDELVGTQIKYNYRSQPLTIDLNMNGYAVSNDQFTIAAHSDFGFFSSHNKLQYFNGSDTRACLELYTVSKTSASIEIQSWQKDSMAWTQSCPQSHANKLQYAIKDLRKNSFYTILLNNKTRRMKSGADGSLQFDCLAGETATDILVEYK